MVDKPKVFLTRQLPPESMAILQQQSHLTVNADDRVLQKGEIIDAVADVDREVRRNGARTKGYKSLGDLPQDLDGDGRDRGDARDLCRDPAR